MNSVISRRSLIAAICASALSFYPGRIRAEAELYPFPKLDEEKIPVRPQKRESDPFIKALSRTLKEDENALADPAKDGIGRGELIRLVLLSRRCGKTLPELVKERKKGTKLAALAADCKADNQKLRSEALGLLKLAEAEAEKIRHELRKSSAAAGAAQAEPGTATGTAGTEAQP